MLNKILIICVFIMSNACNTYANPTEDFYPNPIRLTKMALLGLFTLANASAFVDQDTSPQCPKLEGPFLDTCNITKTTIGTGQYIEICTFDFKCYNNEGDKTTSSASVPADYYILDSINNINGIPKRPNALVPLTGGTLEPEMHEELCAKALFGTFSKSCNVTSTPLVDVGLYLCILDGLCQDLSLATQTISNIVLVPGAYGGEENIENCDSYLVYTKRDACTVKEEIAKHKASGRRTGMMN